MENPSQLLMKLSLAELKFIRGHLNIHQMYKPYVERGEMTKASWSPMHENLLIRVEDEIRRQFPNCPQWSPYGQFDAILKGLKELDQMTTANATKTIRLTDEQYSLLTDLFSSIADLDLQEHCDDSEEFDSLWDAVLDADD